MLNEPLHLFFFVCTYCGKVVLGEPEYTIHRDGFGEGPEVPLCNGCGAREQPSCEDIWRRIAQPDPSATSGCAPN